MTFTQDVTGRQLPWLQQPACELGDDLLHAMGAMPAWTYYGSQEKQEKKKYRNAGRCSQLWEELEMELQRKIGAGI